MFQDRLKDVMRKLDCSVSEVAKYADCDKSNISRMVSGARVPLKDGKAMHKLIDGLYLLADEKNKIEDLCSLIACRQMLPMLVKESLQDFLFEGMDNIKERHRQEHGFRYFGEKFNALMEISQLSNARFARMVNMDASYISRFRSGLRTPRSSKENVTLICSVLLSRIKETGKIAELSLCTGIDEEILNSEEDSLKQVEKWLCDYADDKESVDIEQLIENIANLQIKRFMLEMPKVTYEEKDCYIGINGIREVVLRFLSEAISCQAKDFYLYSDEETDWMVGDENYKMLWSMLMAKCVLSGIHIHIIHNIDRDISEMIDAINAWLPLYMSGMIESYYCRKEKNRRFSHTFFIADHAVIEGNHVAGDREYRMYRYHANKEEIDFYRQSFLSLLEQSRSLVKTIDVSREQLSLAGMKHVTVFRNTLALATMKESTFNKILQRNKITGDLKKQALTEFHISHAVFDLCINDGYFHECSVSDPNANIDLLCATLKYDQETYDEHIEEIIRVSKQYPAYRFFELPDTPFPYCRLLLADHISMITRLQEPMITFLLSHVSMCNAFETYAAALKDQYREDKPSQIQRLLNEKKSES